MNKIVTASACEFRAYVTDLGSGKVVQTPFSGTEDGYGQIQTYLSLSLSLSLSQLPCLSLSVLSFCGLILTSPSDEKYWIRTPHLESRSGFTLD